VGWSTNTVDHPTCMPAHGTDHTGATIRAVWTPITAVAQGHPSIATEHVHPTGCGNVDCRGDSRRVLR